MADAPPPEPPRPTDAARLEIARLTPANGVPLAEVLRRVCVIAAETLGVERVGVWFFVDQHRALRCCTLYERSKAAHSEGVTLRSADFPNYVAALESHRTVAAGAAATDPRTAELAGAYLTPLGVTSLLDAAVYRDGTVVGVMCHEHTGPPREWTTEEQDFAASVADMVALKLRAAELTEVRAALREQGATLAALEKADALAHLAAGAAHDFRNVLTVVQGAAGLLAERRDLPPDAAAFVRQILDAAGRGAALVNEMLAFGQADAAAAARVIDPGELLDQLLPMLRTAAGPRHPVRVVRQGGWPVFLDPGQLERAVLNLVVNARDAMPGGGTVVVSVGGAAADPADGRAGMYTVIEVADTGAGMDEATKARMFDPFFTTKPWGRGTGLGLAIVRRTVDRAGGFIRVESEPGRGTRMRLFLPRVAGE